MTEKSTLSKSLGFAGVFCLASGAMISSGLFVLPSLAFAKAGPACIFSYALASILMLPLLLSKTELATAMPKSGGTYFFVERSLGPLMGTVAGVITWLSVSLKSSFALIGIGAMAQTALGSADGSIIKYVAIIACAVFVFVNLLGSAESGKLQVALVAGLFLIIVIYLVTGIREVDPVSYKPLVTNGWNSVLIASGMVFVSYGGLTKVAAISEEVENPSRNIPLGMFFAYAIVSAAYVLVVFVVVGLLSSEEITSTLTPISTSAEKILGRPGFIMVEVGAFLAFATTANSGILAASRSPLAMSRDGLIPEFFGHISRKRKVPYISVITTGVFIAALIALLSIEDLVKTASAMILLSFILENIAVIIMRESQLQNYRPTFKSPLYPWLQIFAIVVYTILIFEMGATPLLLMGAFSLLSACWYLLYVMRKIDRESALVYLVKSVISQKIYRSDLEEELKQITIERDDIAHDRFDILVQNAEIIDIDGSKTALELFEILSEHLCDRIKMPAAKIRELFIQREKESSTVVHPGLAIPHIIIDGEGIFDLCLVRCREGIVFSELNPPVKMAFVLMGTVDERNYHLKALMNIARIVEQKGFETRWMNARGPEDLRDTVLLSGRSRDT